MSRLSPGTAAVRPTDLAVFELITSSKLVGCSNGQAPGFAPWSTMDA